MTKFEMVMEVVRQQLEMNREGIDNPNIELMTIELRFKPHGGMIRSARSGCLHAYEGNGSERQPAMAKA